MVAWGIQEFNLFDLPSLGLSCKLPFMTKTKKEAKKSYETATIKKIEGSRVEITGTISAETFMSCNKKALQNINDEVTIDGFRKGKVPESVLISKVGEMNVLEEMAQLALSKAYPEIVITEKIDVIGRPEIHITKIAKDNPLEFKVITSVVPEVKLGDYKKIAKEEMAKKEEEAKISDKELEDAIKKIRRSRVDHSTHTHENMSHEDHEKLVEASLPELNDAFVTSLGGFKDVADFKEKITASLLEDKKERNREKKRVALSDKIIETSTIEIPDLLVESELRRIEAQFGDDIAQMGVTVEDYLKHAKKTIEDLRKDWKPSAEKKAKLQLILNKIATDEKITVDPKEIETEVKHIIEHYKDADRERAAVYAETVLMNEKVFKFLEGQK